MIVGDHDFQPLDDEGFIASDARCINCGTPRSTTVSSPYAYQPCRPSWPETWMNIAKEMSRRSYDPRLKVGCVIVSDDNTVMLSAGYNGNAKNLPNYPESFEPGKSGFLHAELNAVIKTDFNFPKKKHMYCTHSTCRACAKIVINAGISRFVYNELYRDESGLELLRLGGVEVLSLNEAILISR